MMVDPGGLSPPQLNSTTSASPTMATIVGNLWQVYGGAYGQYFIWINSASLTTVFFCRILNWAPSICEHLSSFLWSSLKAEFDALVLWQTGKLETHHQYLVMFFFGSSTIRFGGTWQCSPEIQTLWYGPFIRLLSRASNYTIMLAMFLEYDKISWPFMCTLLLSHIVSRTYEVFYPWLDVQRPTSPLRISEQMKIAMIDFDKEASASLLASPILPWSQTFHKITHSRLLTFRMNLKSSGILFPISVIKDNPSLQDNLHQAFFGWVEGSVMLSVINFYASMLGILGLAMAEDTPLLTKLGLCSWQIQCLFIYLYLSIPSLTFHMEKLALAIQPSNFQEEARCHHNSWRIEEQHQLWWSETQEFIKSLLTFGFPFQYHGTILESPLSIYFWHFLALLEGIELTLYVFLATCIKIAFHISIYGMVLLIKSSRLGGSLSLLCMKFRSLLIRKVVARIPFPRLSRGTIDLLNAETALASQKVCPQGQCIATIRLDEILRTLEEIVARKGQVEVDGAFFLHPLHAIEEGLEFPEEEELKHRAVAIGLMQSATCAVDKLMRALKRKKEGALALHSLLQLLRVYLIDFTVPNERTKMSMMAVANLVEKVLTESISHHWDAYKTQDQLEANYCGCISDTDWLIMVAQLNVSILLVYAGWRSSSLCWPYKLCESETLKNWVNVRFSDPNIAVGGTECFFLFL